MDILENFRNILSGSNNKLTNIDDKKILEFSKTLNLINKDKELVGKSSLNMPSIVVIGSQSSGKSSVLNGILAMDLLPTGKNMVTRTPLNMELVQTKNEMFAEFGFYDQLSWVSQKKIRLSNPLPTKLEIEQIQKEIVIQTNKKAGLQMNISEVEINIKIFSPYVPNINLIDLPGLTMVACLDKGQPEDIKTKIRQLSKKYIYQNNNLILCVMPAREDIEADNALELAKECDKDFSRTIGVLTKVDLMNKDNNVLNYLTNNISKSLKLKYGYYAIKNRNNEEMKTKNIIEGMTLENNYFLNHPDYKNYSTLNMGINKLSSKLNEILLNSIREHIPKIIKNINEIQIKNDNLLEELGEPVPSDQQLKLSLMNRIINKIHHELIDNLEKKGSEINTGRNIKDIFIEFRKALSNQNPFLEKDCPNNLLTNIINNCEGNHMTFAMPSIELLESCLKDSKISPFSKLLPFAYTCLDRTNHELKELVSTILKKEFINRFPKLVCFLQESINKEIFDKNRTITFNKINEIIEYEKNYIWTDDPNFLEIMNNSNMNNSNRINECLRNLCEKYFQCINFILQHSIPKSIMFFLVNKSQKELQSFLFDKTNNKIEYLCENSGTEEKRKKYNLYKEMLSNSLNTLQNI